MNAKTARKVENDNQATGAAWSKPKNSNGKMIGDKRPSSLKVAQLRARIDHSPRQAVQRKKRDDIQQGADQRKENKTGIPDNLKSGIENLSAMDMSDVKVHYNSSKPSQLNAHAYTQGNDIHIASGQQKHLPHEAWHAIQQKQGRVKPTIQMKEVAINDDASLEKESDVMGGKAVSLEKEKNISCNFSASPESLPNVSTIAQTPILQAKFGDSLAGISTAKLKNIIEQKYNDVDTSKLAYLSKSDEVFSSIKEIADFLSLNHPSPRSAVKPVRNDLLSKLPENNKEHKRVEDGYSQLDAGGQLPGFQESSGYSQLDAGGQLPGSQESSGYSQLDASGQLPGSQESSREHKQTKPDNKQKAKYIKKEMSAGMTRFDARPVRLKKEGSRREIPKTTTFYAKNEKERAPFIREFKEGVMKDNSGKALTTIGSGTSATLGSKPDRHIFAMNEHGQFSTGDADAYFEEHAHKDKKRLHHSSFYAGKGVAGAGEMRVRNGQVEVFSDNSGHYRPESKQMLQVARELQDKKAGIEKISSEFIGKEDKGKNSMTLRSTALEILGYENERKPELIENRIRKAHEAKDKVMDELRNTFQEAREKPSSNANTAKETKKRKK